MGSAASARARSVTHMRMAGLQTVAAQGFDVWAWKTPEGIEKLEGSKHLANAWTDAIMDL